MLFSKNGLASLTAFLLFSLFMHSCKKKSNAAKAPRENPATIVDVMIAESRTVSNLIEANGTVVANEYLELHPEVSGRLTYLNIAEGEPVAKGTVMARINDADLRAQLNKIRVQLQLAETTVGRYKQLLDVSGINQSDYDLAVNTVNGYKADIQYTQSLLDKTVIRAPFSGVVGLRQVSPGAYVTPASVIATLQQVSKVKIDFTLPEIYANVVKTGSLIDVSMDVGGEKKEKALVIATEPGANTDTRNIKVRAELQNVSVNPGAFVKVYLDEGKGRSSILVPTNCIVPEDKTNQVVVVKDGKAKFLNVQTGTRFANNIEITSGLTPGDSVVVTGVLFARPGAAVKVRSVKQITDQTATDSTRS